MPVYFLIKPCFHLGILTFIQADAQPKKKRTFRKFTYRGVDLDQLLDLQSDNLMELVHARARRRFSRGLKRKPLALIKKLRKAKKEAPPMEKPEVVKTHLRNMIVVPEMIGSVIGVYNGKTFNQIEVKVRYDGKIHTFILAALSQIAKFAVRGEDLPRALLYLSAQNI